MHIFETSIIIEFLMPFKMSLVLLILPYISLFIPPFYFRPH